MGGGSIMLIEDDPDDEALTLRMFDKCGVKNRVVVVRDGAEALEYLFGEANGMVSARHDLPTVVLLDLKLPKVNGIDLLRRIRGSQRTKALPVVILTSSKQERDLVNGYELGTNSCVRKPVDFGEFSKAIGQLGLHWLLLDH